MDSSTNTLPAQSSVGLPPEVRSLIDLRMQRHQLFVEHYCVCGNARAAAVSAGYSPRAAKQKGQLLLHHPQVSAAIARVRTALAERNRYTLDKALVEIDNDLAGARQADQWSAVSTLQRVKQQLCGHLVDRIDARIQQVPFTIELRGFEPAPPIDGEVQELPR